MNISFVANFAVLTILSALKYPALLKNAKYCTYKAVKSEQKGEYNKRNHLLPKASNMCPKYVALRN